MLILNLLFADAKFWVGRGNKPSPQGIRVPDENGKEVPLRRYDRKTIVLTLPGDTTIFDIGHFGVWCEAFAVDFGHVRIPRGLNVPPSLKMLGVSPQVRNCIYLFSLYSTILLMLGKCKHSSMIFKILMKLSIFWITVRVTNFSKNSRSIFFCSLLIILFIS